MRKRKLWRIINEKEKQHYSRTITPDSLGLDVATYDIIATGPDGGVIKALGITKDTSTHTFKNLVHGEWSVVAKGLNSDGIVIVQSGPTTITLNGTDKTTTLYLLPIEGNGIFKLDLSWPADLIETPVITATLTPDEGTEITLDFTNAGDNLSAAVELATLARGYYTLSLKLNDDGDNKFLAWSKVETVLIFTGNTSSRNWVLRSTDMNGANPQDLELTLDVDTQSPIDIDFDGAVETLAFGATMTVNATSTPAPTSWKWYLDGDVLEGETSSSVTVGTNLAAGSLHTLTAIARVGTIAGSTDVTFRIGAAPVKQQPVYLKTAVGYAILAKDGISGNPDTSVVGNIGGPTATLITIPASSVDGNVYASDDESPTPSNLTQALADADAAYTDAAGRTSPDTTRSAFEIGGETFAPGLHKFTGPVTMVNNLTLDGPADGVWIFQMGASFSPAATVTLTGGAQAKNIFWQVGDAFTLGASAHLEGVVLANSTIGLTAGATVNGRLFAKTSVAVPGSTVTQP